MEISRDYDKNNRPFHLRGEGTATRRLFLREVSSKKLEYYREVFSVKFQF